MRDGVTAETSRVSYPAALSATELILVSTGGRSQTPTHRDPLIQYRGPTPGGQVKMIWPPAARA